MWTICIEGISPHHSEIAWYRNYMDDESARIMNLFKHAKEQNWNVFEVPYPHREA